jgi:hypothetical protein
MTEVVVVSDEALNEWIAGAKKQWIKCRVKGHRDTSPFTARWTRIEGSPLVRIESKERCKCGAVIIQRLTETASIVSTRYDYSNCPGYLVEHGAGRIIAEAKDFLRLILLEDRGILPEIVEEAS